MEKLFSSFSLPLPDEFKTSRGLLPSPLDVLPSGVDEEDVAYVGAFVLCAGTSIFSADLAPAVFWDNGMAHDFSDPLYTTRETGIGWVEIETVLIRLDSGYVPNASFPVWTVSPPPAGYNLDVHIGYDAAVCVEVYEPWVVQIYNSSLGVPTTMNIVGKSASTDFETDDGNRGPRLDSFTRVLNSTGKGPAYTVRYAGSF